MLAQKPYARANEPLRAERPFIYDVGNTRTRLEISTSILSAQLPERETLMCVIEGLGMLEDTQAGDPIEDHRLTIEYNMVNILLDDRGTPTGRFLNDIAGWTLRGMAEWMTKNDHFRELSVKVYYNQYYVGVAELKLLHPQGRSVA